MDLNHSISGEIHHMISGSSFDLALTERNSDREVVDHFVVEYRKHLNTFVKAVELDQHHGRGIGGLLAEPHDLYRLLNGADDLEEKRWCAVWRQISKVKESGWRIELNIEGLLVTVDLGWNLQHLEAAIAAVSEIGA